MINKNVFFFKLWFIFYGFVYYSDADVPKRR